MYTHCNYLKNYYRWYRKTTGGIGCAAAWPVFMFAGALWVKYRQVVENNSRNLHKFVSFSSRICAAFDV